MKKIFLFLTIIFLNIQSVFSANLDDFFTKWWWEKPKYLTELKSEWTWEEAVLTLISQIIDLMLYLSWTIAVWFIIYWWIRMITDFWTDKWIEDAKKIILHSIIWLLVVFISIILVENTDRFIRFVVWSWTL